MFLPIADAPNPKGASFATWTLIVLNVAAFLLINVPLGSQRADVNDPEFREFVMSKIPLGKLATVADVVAAVLYLVSPGAGMVTGLSLKVDGGWTAH